MVINNGLPIKYRWSGWKQLLNTQTISNNRWNQLLEHQNETVSHIVNADVPRTFPTNPFFQKKSGEVDIGRELLYKVCFAIGNYFTTVGYTQGLNFIAGYLLQVSGGYAIQAFSVLKDMLIDDRFC